MRAAVLPAAVGWRGLSERCLFQERLMVFAEGVVSAVGPEGLVQPARPVHLMWMPVLALLLLLLVVVGLCCSKVLQARARL